MDYYYPHFQKRLNDLPEIIQLVSAAAQIQTTTVWLRSEFSHLDPDSEIKSGRK